MSENELTALKVALYDTEVKYSYFYPFKKYLQLKVGHDHNSESISEPLKLLLERDYLAVKKVRENLSKSLIERDDQELFDWFESINQNIAKFFPGYKKPNLSICDDYPGVFAGRSSSAIHVDYKEEIELGVQQGIYILRQNTNYPFFEITVAHELIHHVIATFSEQRFRYVSFFEEGFCDYLAYYFLLKFDYLKPLAIKTYLNNSRYFFGQNLAWESYYKFSLQALRVVNCVGIHRLVKVIREQGRVGLEKLTFNVQVSREEIEEDTTQRDLFNLFLEVGSGQILTPDEYLFLEYVINNRIHEFELSELSLPKEIADPEKAIDQLVKRSLINLLHGKYHNSFEFMPSNLKYNNSY